MIEPQTLYGRVFHPTSDSIISRLATARKRNCGPLKKNLSISSRYQLDKTRFEKASSVDISALLPDCIAVYECRRQNAPIHPVQHYTRGPDWAPVLWPPFCACERQGGAGIRVQLAASGSRSVGTVWTSPVQHQHVVSGSHAFRHRQR